MANVEIRGPTTLRATGYISSLLFGVLFGLGGCSSIVPGGGQAALQANIAGAVFSSSLDQILWGVLVVEPGIETPLYSLNAHKKFVPASNMKILPTATALSLMGPEYRYETAIWGVGDLTVETGVMEGDLVLRAAGDPTLSERFYPSAEAPLDSLADDLWAGGIRTVTGSLVVDASAWDSATVRGTWMVGDLAGTSAATGGAFAFAEGILTLEARGGEAPGDPARVRWWPQVGDDLATATFVTTHPDSGRGRRTTHYRPELGRVHVNGNVRVGEVDTIRVGQREPVPMASSALLLALERRGIQVEGGLRIAFEPGQGVGPGDCTTGWVPGEELAAENLLPGCHGATRFAVLSSPPMAEIVKAILEPSQNWMAEQLVRTLGMVFGQQGTWQEGFRVQREFLVQEVGVDSLDLAFRDGSGLSTQNLVTPRAIVRVLEFMRESGNGGVFQDALAGPGEEGSTLSRRLTGLEGRVFAKTGTLTHVASLSGYVRTDSGKLLIFSIFTNNSGISSQAVRAGIDEVVTALARW